MPNLEQAFARFAAPAETGIAKTVNGPFVFSPDGNPLIGPMPWRSNHFAAAAFLAGLNIGGGFGEAIAEWIDTGRTGLDLASCDVGRFGDRAPGAFSPTTGDFLAMVLLRRDSLGAKGLSIDLQASVVFGELGSGPGSCRRISGCSASIGCSAGTPQRPRTSSDCSAM